MISSFELVVLNLAVWVEPLKFNGKFNGLSGWVALKLIATHPESVISVRSSYRGIVPPTWHRSTYVASFHHRGDGTRAQGELFPPPRWNASPEKEKKGLVNANVNVNSNVNAGSWHALSNYLIACFKRRDDFVLRGSLLLHPVMPLKEATELSRLEAGLAETIQPAVW